MGGAWPTLACSHLASLLQMVPLKPSLPTSSARWLASLRCQLIGSVLWPDFFSALVFLEMYLCQKALHTLRW